VSVAAFHEAGHALGYVLHDRPIISVSIDGENGLTAVPPTLIHRNVGAYIAALGPIAEAVQTLSLDEDVCTDDDTIEFGLHLTVAICSGGHADYADSLNRLDEPSWVASLREEVVDHWDGVTRLALALVERGTVPGAEAVELLR